MALASGIRAVLRTLFTPPDGPDTVGRRLLDGLCVLAVSLLFFSRFWNRYLAPTAGGELTAAFLLERGILPYRDYHAAGPPGLLLTTYALMWLGHGSLAVVWAAGVALRSAYAVVLFAWLSQHVASRLAAFAVASALILSSPDIADYPFFYNHLTVGFASMSAFALERSLSAKRQPLLALLAGMLSAWSCAIKQTTGILVPCLLLATLAALAVLPAWRRKTLVAAAFYLFGFGLPIAAMLVWLAGHGALPSFVEQVLTRGPQSKGGIGGALLRPWVLTATHARLRDAALFGIGALVVGIGVHQLEKRAAHRQARASAPSGGALEPRLGLWLPLSLGLAILVGFRAPALLLGPRLPGLALCYLAMWACAIWCVRRIADWPPLSRQTVSWTLLTGTSFVTALSLSLSWAAFETMLFPSSALAIAMTVHELGNGRGARLTRAVVLGGALCLSVQAAARKALAPHSWGRWQEPPLSWSTATATPPALRGFRLSPQTARFYDGIVERVRASSSPEDTLLVYPNMPILYALTARRPATRALVHWVDVCPDELALDDARRIVQAPPAVVIIHPDLDWELALEERIFRDGRPSGVRTFRDVLLRLLRTEYELDATYAVPGHSVPVQVMVRRDKTLTGRRTPEYDGGSCSTCRGVQARSSDGPVVRAPGCRSSPRSPRSRSTCRGSARRCACSVTPPS